jgi:hypothetical protein
MERSMQRDRGRPVSWGQLIAVPVVLALIGGAIGLLLRGSATGPGWSSLVLNFALSASAALVYVVVVGTGAWLLATIVQKHRRIVWAVVGAVIGMFAYLLTATTFTA